MIKRRVLLGQAMCPRSRYGAGKAGDGDREGHPFLWETSCPSNHQLRVPMLCAWAGS